MCNFFFTYKPNFSGKKKNNNKQTKQQQQPPKNKSICKCRDKYLTSFLWRWKCNTQGLKLWEKCKFIDEMNQLSL